MISMKHLTHKKYFSYFIYSLLFISIIVTLPLFGVPSAHAMTPTLYISPLSDGDSVQLNITGDPNTSVLFYYTKAGSGQQITPIGNTNSSGTLLYTISSSYYGISSGSAVHVTLGGINGTQSQEVTWPSVSSYVSGNNMLSLSQTGLVLSIGQSSTLTASNLNSSTLYLSANTNPKIANLNINGSQITVYANSYGSTVATFCLISNSSNCSSVYITVQNSNAQPLTFSQSSVSMYSGQSISIQVSGGSGSYTVLSNSSQNQGAVTASISGNNVVLSTNSTSGSSSITVCTTDMVSCGIINVTIGNNTNSANVTFSQNNPTISVGQSLNVNIYGPTNSLFYVSSNSNPGVVQANLSNSVLTLIGIGSGSSNLSICASSSNCGTLAVTVNYSSSSGSRLVLSQESVNLSVGQTVSVTISGGSMPYNISSSADNIFRPTLNVNVLSIYGVSNGSSLMNICSYSGSCATLSVTVGSSYQSSYSSSLPSGCTSSSGYSAITGLSCSGTSTASTLPYGCTTATGYSSITGLSCSSTSTSIVVPAGCTASTIFSSVTGQTCPNYVAGTSSASSSSSSSNTSSTTSSSSKSSIYKFTAALKLGSKGEEVKELQKKLKSLGYYKGTIDGSFGPQTEKSVKAFQKAHKLSQVGNVGPGTRAALNKK